MTDSESIRLQGTKKELMQLIPQLTAMRELIATRDVGIIYAYTKDLPPVPRKGKPKVTLFFLEDKVKGSPKNYRRQEGVIRFRLMDETTQTFSEANGKRLGAKIKELFGSAGGFVWNKGKTLYTYCDWDKGYQFQLLCKVETEAKRIITTTLAIQNHQPDWLNFQTVKPDDELSKYPENPGTQIVMGEQQEKPQHRPIVDVRFQYSFVSLNGVKEPINLYDISNTRLKPLVK